MAAGREELGGGFLFTFLLVQVRLHIKNLRVRVKPPQWILRFCSLQALFPALLPPTSWFCHQGKGPQGSLVLQRPQNAAATPLPVQVTNLQSAPNLQAREALQLVLKLHPLPSKAPMIKVGNKPSGAAALLIMLTQQQQDQLLDIQLQPPRAKQHVLSQRQAEQQ